MSYTSSTLLPLLFCALGALQAVHAQPVAVVGILQGEATLVRQATRHALVEGAALSSGDIVQTGAGAFAQIEFADGGIASLGEATRVLLRPTLGSAMKSSALPRLYLNDGLVKAAVAAKPQGDFTISGPRFEVVVEGVAIVRADGNGYALFAERGAARVTPRDGARSLTSLKGGEFLQQRAPADKPVIAPRMTPEFLQLLPRPFRETLPARAELFAKRNPAPRPLAPVTYDDVRIWVQAEPGIRLPLNRQWRERVSDKSFRHELATNLNAHREWERVLFPERFLPKKPPPPVPAPATTPSPGAITGPSLPASGASSP